MPLGSSQSLSDVPLSRVHEWYFKRLVHNVTRTFNKDLSSGSLESLSNLPPPGHHERLSKCLVDNVTSIFGEDLSSGSLQSFLDVSPVVHHEWYRPTDSSGQRVPRHEITHARTAEALVSSSSPRPVWSLLPGDLPQLPQALPGSGVSRKPG